MTYTRTTWQNGVTPANATNMNNIESWIDRVANTPGIQVNGATSGTVLLYQPFQETEKRVLIYMNNYRSGGSPQTIVLPAAFTKGAHIRAGGIGVSGSGGLQLLASSVAQNLNIITSWAAAGGSVTVQNTIFAYSIAEMMTAFDTISFPINTTNAHTAYVVIEGQ